MKTTIQIIAVFCGLAVARGADEFVPDNRTIIVPTNVACTIQMDTVNGWDVGPAPVCFVRLTNSSDSFVQTLRLSAEQLFRIKLTDTNGQTVKKTEYGRQFGQPLTQKEVQDWFRPIRRGNGRWFVPSGAGGEHYGDAPWFSISKAFKITQSGEYTFHIQMRLIQTKISDANGTVRTNVFDNQYLAPKTKDINFQAIWLPEVTAKIQLQQNYTPESQSKPTNSPSQ